MKKKIEKYFMEIILSKIFFGNNFVKKILWKKYWKKKLLKKNFEKIFYEIIF